jgi:hypothetical protein
VNWHAGDRQERRALPLYAPPPRSLTASTLHDDTQAKRLKNEAATRPGLKQLYVNVGQWTHRATAWITISAAGHKSLGVRRLFGVWAL